MEKNYEYANIIIDISHEKVDRAFQYVIPEHLRETLAVGMQVHIPFGLGNKEKIGYVIEVTNILAFDRSKLKEIISINTSGVTLEAGLIRLAYWMKEQYGSTMITALKTVLPVKQKIKALTNKKVRLLITSEKAEVLLLIYKKKRQVARIRLLEALLEVSPLPYGLVVGKLNVTFKTMETMQSQGVILIESQDVYRNPVKFKEQVEERKLLSEKQQFIVDEILDDAHKKKLGTYLIHGITGSGKTEVYMEIIAGIIAQGKQAIVLIPEIALTYQTALRFYKRFGDRVSIVNSKLSQGEKFDQMERAKKGEIDIMIGPRSALFTPFRKLGIIIIDEEHETSYKSDSMPKYHAREVALQIALNQEIGVVLGSATPSLESYYKCKQGEFRLFELTQRLTGGSLPTVYVEDLRVELQEGNRSIFSKRLQELIQKRLDHKEQIMLFLNRRGYAGFVSCRACGLVMKCPHCDISLSQHKNGTLQCHYCGYIISDVKNCPKCNSKYILGFKAGTQQIEELLQKTHPNASILRMDADTTKKKDSYEKILSSFMNQEADILIGTQMIVKGHDFHNVTLVGILAADLSLAANDYRAGERTFQLLTQAVGRAGRGRKAGEVVIQTYQPDHYSVVHASHQDFHGFYQEEIEYRSLLSYPPSGHMMAILIIATEEKYGLEIAKHIVLVMNKQNEDMKCRIIGPAPASVGKISDLYRFVIYVKDKDYDKLIILKDIVEKYMDQLNSKKIMLQFDFNPMNSY